MFRTLKMNNAPKCFISYSWDNEAHCKWVKDFAADLRQNGVTTILDRWHAVPGDLLTEFMEKMIRESDFVLIICSPKYKDRSDNRKGGVGYEGDIITGEIFINRQIRKFIPILRTDCWENSAPSFLLGKYYIDLSDDPISEENYKDLLATIFGIREDAPPVGMPPLEMLKEYAILQKQIDQCNWTKFESRNLAVFYDNDANRTSLILTIRDSLIKVYGENFKSFSIFLTVSSVTTKNSNIILYSLIGHQRKFIYECYKRHKQEQTELIIARQSEHWKELREQFIIKCDEREKEYLEWDVDVRIDFSASSIALNIEYDPELKRIKIFSDSNPFTDPKMYDNKVKTTSEAIQYTSAVCNSKYCYLGDIGWHFENLPLTKLLIDILDHVDIKFSNFRCQIENAENWDYINPRFEAEIRGFS